MALETEPTRVVDDELPTLLSRCLLRKIEAFVALGITAEMLRLVLVLVNVLSVFSVMADTKVWESLSGESSSSTRSRWVKLTRMAL